MSSTTTNGMGDVLELLRDKSREALAFLRNATRPEMRPLLACGAALLFAIAYLFHGGIGNLWARWGGQQELSHSYFIPIITAWMLWDRRDALQKSLGRPSALGIPLLLFGIFMVYALKQLNVYLLEHIGLIVALFAVPLLFGGTSLLRLCMVPLAYLIFMIPPPYWLITQTSWEFQKWSSELGVMMIRPFNIPVELNGNVIVLPNITLQVVEACSGLRYLFPFVSLAAIAAYFYRGPLWQRIVVVLAAIPITIVMNSFRIAITGVLSENYGASHTEGLLHFFEGWVVFVLCLVILAAVLVAMARLSGHRQALQGLGLPHINPVTPSGGGWSRDVYLKLVAGSAAFLAVTSFALHRIDVPLKVPARQEFAELPLEFSGWKSIARPLDVATERVLQADDYIVLDLISPEEGSFNLYIAYLDQQRSGGSWHSPQQCLPGGGWNFTANEIIPTPDNAPAYHYNRLVMEKDDTRFLVYYWYQQRGDRIADEYVMRLNLIKDVLTTRRSDGAMIRVMTRIGEGETIKDADARLQGFQRRLEDVLDPYIPT
ncbi:MAG: VPLPA-CTERM-specific exosortase XrtD [Pseudomonadota bacterium]